MLTLKKNLGEELVQLSNTIPNGYLALVLAFTGIPHLMCSLKITGSALLKEQLCQSSICLHELS